MDTSSRESQSRPLDTLRYAVGSDVGRRREENQDSHGYLEQPNLKFYIVADGMGGAKGGATASALAIKVVTETLTGAGQLGVPQLISAVQKANNSIFDLGSNDEALSGMGTTFVGLAFIGTSMAIVNVGDSRAYRIRGNSIFQMTSDHTLVNELLRTGAIGPDQVENHPVAHMLTRSLGPTGEIEVDCWVSEDGPAKKDKYLLCSDGLYNLVPPTDILRMVRQYPLEEAVQKLIDLANERGGTDNITVMIIEVGEDYPLSIEDYAVFEEESEESEDRPELHTNGEDHSEPISAVNGSAAVVEENDSTSTLTENPASAESLVNQGAEAVPSRSLFSRRPIQIGTALIVALLLVFAGTQLQRFTQNRSGGEQQPILNPLATTIAESVIDTSAKSALYESPLPVLLPLRSGAPHPQTEDGGEPGEDQTPNYANHQDGLTPQQSESVQKRKEILVAELAKIEARLAAFDKPLSGDLMDQLKKIEADTQSKTKAYENLSADLDQATRKLSIWYGRRQRLQSADPVDLASEVAVSSDAVKSKKEDFERVTWSYLKEVEVWRLNPNDAELTKSVSKLGRDREQARRELGGEVRRAIEENKAASEREISELTTKRDQIQSELDNLNEEAKFIRVLTSNNPVERKSTKEELMLERDQLSAELEELKHMAL